MHLISLKDWSDADVMEVVEKSIAIKKHPGQYADTMSGRSLALLFQKTSTRTRCAGEVGMTQLGGHGIYLDWQTTNFTLADLGDEIRVLSDYSDLILARFLKHADVVRAAECASVSHHKRVLRSIPPDAGVGRSYDDTGKVRSSRRR